MLHILIGSVPLWHRAYSRWIVSDEFTLMVGHRKHSTILTTVYLRHLFEILWLQMDKLIFCWYPSSSIRAGVQHRSVRVLLAIITSSLNIIPYIIVLCIPSLPFCATEPTRVYRLAPYKLMYCYTTICDIFDEMETKKAALLLYGGVQL